VRRARAAGACGGRAQAGARRRAQQRAPTRVRRPDGVCLAVRAGRARGRPCGRPRRAMVQGHDPSQPARGRRAGRRRELCAVDGQRRCVHKFQFFGAQCCPANGASWTRALAPSSSVPPSPPRERARARTHTYSTHRHNNTHTRTHTHTFIHTYMHTHSHTHTHTHTHTRTHAHTHKHKYIHICMHTYTRARTHTHRRRKVRRWPCART
jgi:hypothetical protein